MKRCEWTELKKILPQYSDAVIFGVKGGRRLLEHLNDYFDKIYFCDNDTNLVGTITGEYVNNGKFEVISVEEACQHNCLFLIPDTKSQDEKREQLLAMGIADSRIINPYDTLIPFKCLHFEVHVSEHCNLNCKYCNHMSPLADKKFVNIDELTKSYIRLSQLSGGKVDHIHLLGGEPLLNPQLTDIVHLTRKYFPYGRINIITNGLLLQKMTDEFFNVLKTENVNLLVTEYPVKFDYKRVFDKILANGVNIYSMGKVKSFLNVPLNSSSDQNPDNNFKHCIEGGNNCIQLSGDKLYSCARISNIHHYNKKVGKEIFREDEGIDIYKVSSLEDLMSKLAKPVNFCRYCDFDSKSIEKWQTGNNPADWVIK